MTYASKVNLGCDVNIDFTSEVNLLGAHVVAEVTSKPRIIRWRLSKVETASVLMSLPKALQKYCVGISKSKIVSVGPHIHTHDLCVINFYYRTGGEKTVFYTGEYVQDDVSVIDNGNGYHMLQQDLLIPAMSYTASAGDVWVLDTHKAHAVIGGDSNTERWVLQVYMDMPYEQVLEHLQIESDDVSQTRLAA